ncbi:galactokinase family protein [Corynebacterium guangdongense]|uniref:Galactokinase n=1 Tax=Corynebacterium guangdongense TaxID=1783348 RepID=A0ABU1ZYA0_9CORY|nr:galactokinase family protein [Corynebacterium guangdongense]MDR7329815.1 galactokinase [Corynebacterium guangdongense]WJZ18378.1 Galactokinase [Corynebacterium guangdongense]
MPMWTVTDTPAHERARRLHEEITGTGAVAVADAPATYPLIGEHVDHAGGLVIVGVADLRAAVAYSPRPDSVIRVSSQRYGADGAPGEVETDTIDVAVVSERAAEQQSAIDQEGQPVTPDAPVGGAAARVGGLVWTLVHRQLLSRETQGMDVTIVSDIPAGLGLGADTAVDAALAVALQAASPELGDAPLRARLAEIASQAADTFSARPALRARHTAALRCPGDTVSIIDYADGSVTQAPHPVNREVRGFVVGLPVEKQRDAAEAYALIRRQRLFLEEACRAFGTETLRQLPDAATRVLDWLQAVHKVRGPEEAASTEQADAWLSFIDAETGRAQRAARALRSRRGEEIGQLLAQSQAELNARLGLPASDELAELARVRGALSARATSAGLGESVVALVPAARAANFAADLVAEGFIVVELAPGARADLAPEPSA